MKVGSRESELAMKQTEIFLECLGKSDPSVKTEIVPIKSSGDIDLKTSLDKLQGFGAFVRELDAALLEGRIDVAVNSMKDMPVDVPEGLCVPAVLMRADIRDVIMPCSLDSLKKGSVVGTSSIRRAAILKEIRPDLKTEVLRGNVRTRMAKLDDGKYDAIILAKAGMDRLSVKREMHVLDPAVFIPAPAQGAIALVCRADDKKTRDILSKLNDKKTRAEVDLERSIMKAMGAGCSSPIGVNASLEKGCFTINAVSFDTGEKISYNGKLPEKYSEDDVMKIRDELSGGKRGRVYLVGAGPGDIGLMTVRGLELLKNAEVVVYDALADSSLLDNCRPDAELVNVGKRSRNHIKTQDEINQILVDYAKKGKDVVRLKGGDPFLFGRGAEEASVLRGSGIDVTVIPGVSSSIAVPEIAGVPVTHRDHASCVTIMTGHGKAGSDGIDWVSASGIPGTLVILMGMDNAGMISEGLIKGGKDPKTPAAVITDGARPEQRTAVTVLKDLASTIEKEGLKAPGIIVIGDVVKERERLGDLR